MYYSLCYLFSFCVCVLCSKTSEPSVGVTTLDSPFLVFEGKVVLIPKYRLLGGEKTFFSPKTTTRAIEARVYGRPICD
jgi:hypothetical protein